ncbi:MAG: PIN domain-containing protein [Planctomycetota bacterium]|nr:PIN domain-containing protein [Planctomycetota bacterium]
MNAVDTNVVVYSLDQHEPAKRAKAGDLFNRLGQTGDRPVLLWQVAGELLSCLRKWEDRGRIARTDTPFYLQRIRAMFPLIMPSPLILEKALELSARYSLSHWDSMLLVLAACHDAGVDTLYSEDLDPGMTYETVTVVNPFV